MSGANHIFIPWSDDEAQRAARIAAGRWDTEYEEKVRTLTPSFIRRICRMCVAPDRYDYDIRVLTGEPAHLIAREIGTRYTSKQVIKHRDQHLIPMLADAMPEVRQKNIEAALARPFPFKAHEIDQLDWCVVQMLALREKHHDDPKFTLSAVKEVRNTILAMNRIPAKVPELPAPAQRATDNAIAEFPEHDENLDNAFALSRVRNREEEEAVDVTESRT